MMKDDDFKLLNGFALQWMNKRTNKQTDICDCRVTFATENSLTLIGWTMYGPIKQVTVFIFQGVVKIFLQSIGTLACINHRQSVMNYLLNETC